MNKIYNKIKSYDEKCDNLICEILNLLNKKYNKTYYPEINKIKTNINTNIENLITFKNINNTKIINLYTNYFKELYNYDIDILNLIINYINTYNSIHNYLTEYYNNINTSSTTQSEYNLYNYISYLYKPISYVYNYYYDDATQKNETYEILILKEKYKDIFQYYNNKKVNNINLIVKPYYNFIFKSIILIHINPNNNC